MSIWYRKDMSALQTYIGLQSLAVVAGIIIGGPESSPIAKVLYSYKNPEYLLVIMVFSSMCQVIAPISKSYKWRTHANTLDFFVWGGLVLGSIQSHRVGPVALSAVIAMFSSLFIIYSIRIQYRREQKAFAGTTLTDRRF